MQASVARHGGLTVLIMVVLALAGCSSAGVDSPSPAAVSSPSAGPVSTAASPAPATEPPARTPSPTASPPATPAPTLEPPPGATLVAGTTQAPGSIGSWTWAGGTNAAPWLPASALDPVPLPAGPVRIELGGTGIESWTAQVAPVDDTAGVGATILAEGTGPPAFDAPDESAWVLAVQVVFDQGRGDAVYYWHVVAG